VPLAPQAVAILKAVKEHTGGGKYVFPHPRTESRPMSENAINAALRGLGYTKQQMTGHGFRTVASTLLNEMNWDGDLVELQLSHAERDAVRAAYNRAQKLDERRRMMVAWADHLDALKAGDNKVVPIKRAAS
jgi:integrase